MDSQDWEGSGLCEQVLYYCDRIFKALVQAGKTMRYNSDYLNAKWHSATCATVQSHSREVSVKRRLPKHSLVDESRSPKLQEFPLQMKDNDLPVKFTLYLI